MQLEKQAALTGRRAPKLIVCLVDDVTGTITHNGQRYTRAEWDSFTAANDSEDGCVIEVRRMTEEEVESTRAGNCVTRR
jgi:hypothetical protein